jgi:lipopolysaccharide/colanic/teichoic acid biosynthesis glycosyltransferase
MAEHEKEDLLFAPPSEVFLPPIELEHIRRYQPLKRSTDILGAIAGLVFFLPLMVVAACLIKLTSPGPILFTQWRTGERGRPFRVYKLRTMTNGADRVKSRLLVFSEQDGPAFKMKNDPRVTRVGRYLRKASLDEVPQFLNVLLGNMSLVGPRPLPVAEAQQLSVRDRQRELVKPGMTCYWQVHGRNCVGFREWMEMDRRYIRECCLLEDLKLLSRTLSIPIKLTGR